MALVVREVSQLKAYMLENFGTSDVREVVGMCMATVASLREMLALATRKSDMRIINEGISWFPSQEEEDEALLQQCA